MITPIKQKVGQAIMVKTRIESDTLGEVAIPADALWGAQTERSRHNFPTRENAAGAD